MSTIHLITQGWFSWNFTESVSTEWNLVLQELVIIKVDFVFFLQYNRRLTVRKWD